MALDGSGPGRGSRSRSGCLENQSLGRRGKNALNALPWTKCQEVDIEGIVFVG